jgi:hypothetical protein
MGDGLGGSVRPRFLKTILNYTVLYQYTGSLTVYSIYRGYNRYTYVVAYDDVRLSVRIIFSLKNRFSTFWALFKKTVPNIGMETGYEAGWSEGHSAL